MACLRGKAVAIDLLTVRDELGDRLEAVGGPAYLAKLPDGVPKSTNVPHYAAMVADCASRRRLITMAAGAPTESLAAEVDRLRDLAATPQGEGAEDVAPFADMFDVDALAMVPDVVLPGLAWKGRISILAGAAKAGKSTLLGNAIGNALTNQTFLDQPCGVDGKIAIVTEEPLGTVAARLRKHGVSPENHKGRVFLASPAAGIRVLTGIRRLEPALVVIDTFTAFAVASGAETLNDAAGMRRVTDSLRSISDTGPGVLLIHHLTKGTEVLADSRDIGAAVDQIITFRVVNHNGEPARIEESELRRLSFLGRWPVDALSLTFRQSTQQYHVQGQRERPDGSRAR